MENSYGEGTEDTQCLCDREKNNNESHARKSKIKSCAKDEKNGKASITV